ncbi:hypothetical protein GW17_00026666, partial [Ensete ventricosum]
LTVHGDERSSETILMHMGEEEEGSTASLFTCDRVSALLILTCGAVVQRADAGAPELLRLVLRERPRLVGEHVLDLPQVLVDVESPALESHLARLTEHVRVLDHEEGLPQPHQLHRYVHFAPRRSAGAVGHHLRVLPGAHRDADDPARALQLAPPEDDVGRAERDPLFLRHVGASKVDVAVRLLAADQTIGRLRRR